MMVKGRKLILIIGVCAAATGFIGVSIVSCQKTKKEVPVTGEKKNVDTAAVKVVVSEVKVRSFEEWGSYSADLRGIEDAYLSAPYQGGRVAAVKPVGTKVKAGEQLCDIDGDKYHTALQAALAQVDVAKGELDRAQSNVEKGSIGRSALDAANLGYQNARMLLENAKRAYEDCRCQAPFDGILVSRNIEKFQTVAPGAPTVRLSRVDRLEAVIAIPETEAFSYSEGMKTEFFILQNPDRIYKGQLTSLDRAVEPHSRTVTARIQIANADGSLKPGMVGRARILRHTYPKAIVIPSTALLRLQNGMSAIVVEDNIARQRNVEVGATASDSVLVTKGLKQGDLLVVAGAFQISDGTRVTY